MNVRVWLFASITAFVSSGASGRSSPVSGGGDPDCPPFACGMNGTRVTGRAIELGDGVDRVTLASGETIAFR